MIQLMNESMGFASEAGRPAFASRNVDYAKTQRRTQKEAKRHRHPKMDATSKNETAAAKRTILKTHTTTIDTQSP